MTEAALSVRFQASSSVLDRHLLLTINPTPNPPAQLTQKTSHPAKPSRVRKKRSSAGIDSNVPPTPRCQLREEGQKQRRELGVIGAS